jgi:hypothetical protein
MEWEEVRHDDDGHLRAAEPHSQITGHSTVIDGAHTTQCPTLALLLLDIPSFVAYFVSKVKITNIKT